MAKGVGELGLCGVGAAVANGADNATSGPDSRLSATMDKNLGPTAVDRRTLTPPDGCLRARSYSTSR